MERTALQEQFKSNIDFRFLGLEPLLMPFADKCSAQRIFMYAAQLGQAVIPSQAEFPLIFTGYESKFGKYEFNDAEVDEDITILAVIPRFKEHYGEREIEGNYDRTVFFLRNSTNTVDCFHLKDHTPLNSGFGYENIKQNFELLKPGQLVFKGTKFYTSPAHKGEKYCLGVNANVLFSTHVANTEDAFVISRTLANKLSHTALHTVGIKIRPNMIPLNLYGGNTEYKIVPDIGEQVRPDGILMAFRDISNITSSNSRTMPSLLADINDQRLQRVELLHDTIYYAKQPPQVGENLDPDNCATIVDIQVVTKPDQMRKISLENSALKQLYHYQQLHNKYYQAIVETYKSIKRDNPSYKVSDTVSNLVVWATGMNTTYGSKSKWSPVDKKDPVEYVTIEITYRYTRQISNGFKLTGRDGCKGVISAIWEDKDMPIDEDGFKADILICPIGGFNRMNPTQFYEQFYNRAAELVRRQLSTMDKNKAWKYLLEFIDDVNPVHANSISKKCKTPELRQKFLDECINDGIHLLMYSGLETVTEEQVLYIAKKYGVVSRRIKFNQITADGSVNEIHCHRLNQIGSKYIYLLGKLPDDQLQAVATGYVSHFGTPTRLQGKGLRTKSPLGRTPMRFGNDEICILTMSCGVDTVARLVGVYGDSLEAVDELQHRLLTDPHPTQLKRINMATEDVIKTNRNVSLLAHMLGTCGIDMFNSTGESV